MGGGSATSKLKGRGFDQFDTGIYQRWGPPTMNEAEEMKQKRGEKSPDTVRWNDAKKWAGADDKDPTWAAARSSFAGMICAVVTSPC